MYIRSKKLSKIGHAVSENLRGQNHVRKIEKYILKKRGGGALVGKRSRKHYYQFFL